MTTEFPNLGLPWNFFNFHSDIVLKKEFIPKDSERIGIVNSEVPKGMHRYETKSEKCKIDKLTEKSVSRTDPNRIP